jgi:predicted nucleotidyltransferase
MALEIRQAHRRSIPEMAARHGALNVRIVGSVAREEGGPDSGVDLLFEVEPRRSLLDIVGLAQEFEALLGSRVDVLTDNGLSPYLQQQILDEALAL